VFAVDAGGTAVVVGTGLVWRGEVLQQVFEEAVVDLGRGLAAYTASRRGERSGARVGFPRFKRKTGRAQSFRVRQKTTGGRSAIRVGQDSPRSVTLPKVGVLRVREDTRRLRRMLRTGRAEIVSATVSCRAGRWTVAVSVKAADVHPATRHRQGDRVGEWVGVDRGLLAYLVAATARGEEVLREDDPPRPLRTAQPRLRRLSRQVTGKRKGSANRGKAAARLGRAHTRIRNVRQHYLHQVANALVKTHDRIAMEDLNITGMLHNHQLAGAIADAAWAELARIITYKQQWRGGQILPVDRWYPSTKTCSRCHTITPALPLATRVFQCGQCGYQADRDHNAAINLAIWAEQHHAQIRDPDARGPVTNASRGAGHYPRPRAGRNRPHRRKNPTTTR
jgi:putative transposase